MARTTVKLPPTWCSRWTGWRASMVEANEFTTFTLSRALDSLAADDAQRPPGQRGQRTRFVSIRAWTGGVGGAFRYVHPLGLYALPAGRWESRRVPGSARVIMKHALICVDEYERLASEFNPVAFDADAWARLAAEAGKSTW